MHLTIEKAQEMMDKNNGHLILSETMFTSLPENLKVDGMLIISNTGIERLPDNLTVGGDMHARNVCIKKLPSGLKVGGYLDLRNTSLEQLPDNLTVNGGLDIGGNPLTKLPNNLTVDGNLWLGGSAVTTLPASLIVTGSIYANQSSLNSLADNLKVGDSLYVSETLLTKLSENLIVGGDLDIRDTPIVSLSGALAIGGQMYARGTAIPTEEKKNVRKLRQGEYKEGEYLYADDILLHVRKTRKIGPYTYYVGKSKKCHAISDGVHFSHCENLKRGIEDLQFKEIKERQQEQYKCMTRESSVTCKDAVKMYRILTGACQAGVDRFVSGLDEVKVEYTVQEIIELTKGQYRAKDFESFFSS